MKNMLKEIKSYFKNTSPEQIKLDWDKTKKYDKVGPTFEEYIEFVSCKCIDNQKIENHKEVCQKCNKIIYIK